MPTTSAFQAQYPLSPRKFWKKIIEKIVLWFILFWVMGFLTFLAVQSLVLAFVPTVIIIGLYAGYVSAYIARYYYDANESFITIKKGVFAPAEIHIQYAKFQDVYVDQDILDRIMGLYDVHIASATITSGIEAHIDGVGAVAAEGLKTFLLQKLQNGGTPPTSAITPQAPASASTAGFGKDYSTENYPISSRWLLQSAISWFILATLLSGVLAYYINATATNAETAEIPSGLWLMVFLIIYALNIAYAVLWRAAYSFAFTPDYIVTKKGVIAKTETHVPYRSVQDVTVSQGVFERMLGIATVVIENAATQQIAGNRAISSAIVIPGQPLSRAAELSDAIKAVALTKTSAHTGL